MVTSKEKESRDKNSHISNSMSSPKFNQERKRWQYTKTQKNSISKPRVKEKNEDGWKNYKEMSLP